MPRSFFGRRLAARGKLGHGAARGGFGGLAAGVGVDFGIQHQDVDVPAGGQDMVQTAVTDIVGPAVAADDPDRSSDQIVGEAQQVVGRAGPCTGCELS